jgi:hypothetical protein
MTEGLFAGLDMNTVPSDPFNVPPDAYECTVSDVRIETTKGTTPNTGMVFEYTVRTGDHAGKKIKDWKTFPQIAPGTKPTPEELGQLSWIKSRMLSLGVPEEKINSVTPDFFKGIDVIVTTVKNGDYVNVKTVKLDTAPVASGFKPTATPVGHVNPFLPKA